MSVLVVTPPALLVTKEKALMHLRLQEGDAEDALIEGYIAAASAWIDGPWGWLGQCIGKQTLEVRSNVFAGLSRLPLGPIIEIKSVLYIAADGVERTLASETYEFTGDGLRCVSGYGWPPLRGDGNGVRVQYEAGFETIPPAVEQAVLLLVGQWFKNRMAVTAGPGGSAAPHGVKALLSPYWIRRV